MIEVSGLTKVFRGEKKSTFTALDHLSFTVEEGDIFGFLGPNGAGKTTTIQILATILPPTSGRIKMDGIPLERSPLAIKKRIGIMPENPGFYPHLTARENLVYHAQFYGIGQVKAARKADELLSFVGLEDAAERRPGVFSFGMRKRLALATALINDPKILLLDEPTVGLDPRGMHLIHEIVKNLQKQGITTFYSSHILPEVEVLCNRVAIINNGKLIVVDTIENLKETLGALGVRGVSIHCPPIDEKITDGLTQFGKIERTDRGIDIAFKEGSTRQNISSINKVLVENDIEVFAMVPKEPSLEEIFLKLTSKEATEPKTDADKEKVPTKDK